jgi:hypothetical protein
MGDVDQQIVENNLILEFEEVQDLSGPVVVHAELSFRYFLAIDELLCKPCSFTSTSTSLTFFYAHGPTRAFLSRLSFKKRISNSYSTPSRKTLAPSNHFTYPRSKNQIAMSNEHCKHSPVIRRKHRLRLRCRKSRSQLSRSLRLSLKASRRRFGISLSPPDAFFRLLKDTSTPIDHYMVKAVAARRASLFIHSTRSQNFVS